MKTEDPRIVYWENKVKEIFGCELPLLDKYIAKYDEYKSRAKSKKLTFRLTRIQFQQIVTEDCYICEKDGRFEELGIDRLDNTKGYQIGNVAACCWDCNRMKSNMTMLEFRKYITRLNPNHRLALAIND